MEEKAQAKPKVCILTAGKGSRLEERTKYFNKALLRVGDKAVISHTVDQFDDDTEFVIALGYKGDIVKQYLKIAHPEKKFTFVEIDKYSEPGSGPGYAMLKCKDELQCPFYFVSCDSIIDWKYKTTTNHSWAGCAWIDPKDSEKYCIVRSDHVRCITEIYNKKENSGNLAFTGVAFINEYEHFWELLEKEKASAEDEIQVAPALLYTSGVVPLQIRWFDTGDEEGLQKARDHFKGLQNLDKLDEELYIVNDNVIKYFHNANIAQSRITRAEYIKESIQKITGKSKNFYKYKFIEGKDLFKINSPNEIMEDLLEFANDTLWIDVASVSTTEKVIFKDVCKKFYYDKTISRLDKLYSKIDITEENNIINEIRVPSLKKIFNLINWDYLSDGLVSNFHGDTYFGNIILADDNSFKFIDWRQDFGGLIEHGDRYYDLAKMYNSFLFPYPSIRDEKFYIEEKYNQIKTFVEIPVNIERAKDIFESWVQREGYDLWKIKLLTGIILLNMSPLHEAPLDKYLYYFGKYYLHKVLKENV